MPYSWATPSHQAALKSVLCFFYPREHPPLLLLSFSDVLACFCFYENSKLSPVVQLRLSALVFCTDWCPGGGLGGERPGDPGCGRAASGLSWGPAEGYHLQSDCESEGPASWQGPIPPGPQCPFSPHLIGHLPVKSGEVEPHFRPLWGLFSALITLFSYSCWCGWSVCIWGERGVDTGMHDMVTSRKPSVILAAFSKALLRP